MTDPAGNNIFEKSIIETNTAERATPLSATEFVVRMNPEVLEGATEEFIVVTFAHEAIHALISYYRQNDAVRGEELFPIFFDPRDSNTDYIYPPSGNLIEYETNKKDHETMAKLYVEAMADVIMQLNPNFPREKAVHLAWGGLEGTWAFDLMKIASTTDNAGNNIWEKNIILTNQAERNSTNQSVGVRCIN